MERWRLISDGLLSGCENMATDEAIAALFGADGQQTPTLRLYGWDRPSISVGFLQDARQFEGMGLPVVRRITGGRAVLHYKELTYSIVAGTSHPLFSGGILSSYRLISGSIVSALNGYGINALLSSKKAGRAAQAACFDAPSKFEVLVDGRKLAGSAQRRLRDSFLQHGSILFEIDEGLNESVFGKGLSEKTACFSQYADCPVEAFRMVLIKTMEEAFGASFTEGRLTDRELESRSALMEHKYSSDDWNYGKARAAIANGMRKGDLIGA